MLNKRRNDKDEYTRKHPLTHILYALKRLQTDNMYIYKMFKYRIRKLDPLSFNKRTLSFSMA